MQKYSWLRGGKSAFGLDQIPLKWHCLLVHTYPSVQELGHCIQEMHILSSYLPVTGSLQPSGQNYGPRCSRLTMLPPKCDENGSRTSMAGCFGCNARRKNFPSTTSDSCYDSTLFFFCLCLYFSPPIFDFPPWGCGGRSDRRCVNSVDRGTFGPPGTKNSQQVRRIQRPTSTRESRVTLQPPFSLPAVATLC